MAKNKGFEGKKKLRAFWKIGKAGGQSREERKTKKGERKREGRKEGKCRGRRKDSDINKRDWEGFEEDQLQRKGRLRKTSRKVRDKREHNKEKEWPQVS